MRKKDQPVRWETIVDLCQQKGYRDPELVGRQLYAFFQNDVMKTPVMDKEICAVLNRNESREQELAIHQREQLWLLGLIASTILILRIGSSAGLLSHFEWLKKFGSSPEDVQNIDALMHIVGHATLGFYCTIYAYCLACYFIDRPWKPTVIALLLMTNVILLCDLFTTAMFGK